MRNVVFFFYFARNLDLTLHTKQPVGYLKSCICCMSLKIKPLLFFGLNFISLYNTKILYIHANIITTNVIRTRFRRKSNELFISVSLDCNIIVLIINIIVKFTLDLQIIV